MALFEGEKKWKFYHRDALPRLNPVYDSGLDPVFEPDEENDQELKPVEVTLKSGEILFVPRGSPHRVENVTKSIAISGNFVNASNVNETAKHLRKSSFVDPTAANLLRQFIDNKWI